MRHQDYHNVGWRRPSEAMARPEAEPEYFVQPYRGSKVDRAARDTIRRLFANGVAPGELCEQFHIPASTLLSILKGERE